MWFPGPICCSIQTYLKFFSLVKLKEPRVVNTEVLLNKVQSHRSTTGLIFLVFPYIWQYFMIHVCNEPIIL